MESSLDFVTIQTETKQNKRTGDETVTVFPELHYINQHDLMIRGKNFYAVYDPRTGYWTKSLKHVAEIIDSDLYAYRDSFPDDVTVIVKTFDSDASGIWRQFDRYCKVSADDFHQLDGKLIFRSDQVTREMYATHKLDYDISEGDISAYDELIGTLYAPEERQKLEWAIGSILAGDSIKIQKFYVLYGDTGTGKSTILHIIERLFDGYWISFNAQELGSARAGFPLEPFADNPLVAIQHDGDLSRIEDNTRLNSIASHETMQVNQKFKKPIDLTLTTTLFMGSNKAVRITDSKSGILRRLIDIHPSNRKVPHARYDQLMQAIEFELGAISNHCLNVYLKLGIEYYDSYRPIEMLSVTNDFYTFMEDNYDIFSKGDEFTLEQIWLLYKDWCEQANIQYPLARKTIKEEAKTYFDKFESHPHRLDGKRPRNVYTGFQKERFLDYVVDSDGGRSYSIQEKTNDSPKEVEVWAGELPTPLDILCGECPAQYSSKEGTPALAWRRVKTKLRDLDPTKEHYVNVPEEMKLVVIDFDLKDSDGNKDLHRNLAEAAKWPATYCELSKSGQAVHLHYIYDGDTTKLDPVYSDGIEVKVFKGNAALRRKLTMFNDKPIATISSGLPLKGDEKPVLSFTDFYNEKALRTYIFKNMHKEYVPGTKPSIDFIKRGLDKAYSSGMHYDVRDMRPAVMTFGANSTHHSRECIRLVNDMKFMSEDASEAAEDSEEAPIAFFDIEIFPNLFLVCYEPVGAKFVRAMINPTADEVKELCESFKLIGFNNRRYDNHILYAAMLGYPVEKIYELSNKIIHGSRNAFFREAYNISYADIYDFSSIKKSLKWFEVQLGIHHMELGFRWDEPIDEKYWDKVIEYCKNDVEATAAVFGARINDFHAREMLAQLSGYRVNDPTRRHVTKIIFGDDRNPQRQFIYTDLSMMFPGYKYDNGVSTYRDEVVGEGGFVYSEPGIYFNVNVQDVESMHPHSIKALNLFGEKYTNRFWDIVQARLDIKHGNVDSAKKRLDGALIPFLENASKEDLDRLSYSLKIIINSVYGLTKARFDCEFKDPRNKDNIVAKRGALFMIDLMKALQAKGIQVIHIKTDSIKVHNADESLISFIRSFGEKYGYKFETEAEYSRFCLLNKASYIGKRADTGEWEGKTDTVMEPYVFKTLFSHEDLTFEDHCVVMSVTGTRNLYICKDDESGEPIKREFVGRVGEFVPVKASCPYGGEIRVIDGDKVAYAAGSKGYFWMQSEYMRQMENYDDIDVSYFEAHAEALIASINEIYANQGLPGSFEDFVKEE